jgi:uncharacterized protein RhaS with RHS repeats
METRREIMRTLRKILFIATAAMFFIAQAKAVLYWGRPYDPNLQRWIQRDPIGESGGLNLYGFNHNNSINKNDPLGLQSSLYALMGMGGQTMGAWACSQGIQALSDAGAETKQMALPRFGGQRWGDA